MSTPHRFGLALVLLLTADPVSAHAQGFGYGAGAIPTEIPPNPDPADAPVTAAASRIWAALAKPVSMPFVNETPLEDVLKYVQNAAAESENGSVLQFYVDPRGLMEAEKTAQSPVIINLEGIPLSTSLKLLLDQLDLAYRVQPDGYILITYKGALTNPRSAREEAIVRELEALRHEVAELRSRVAELSVRTAPAVAPTPAAVAEQPRPSRGGGFQ